MAWRVVLTSSVELDLRLFDDQDALMESLMTWVESGPPGTIKRVVHPEGHEQGSKFYEDRMANGMLVQYFVGTEPDL